MRVLVTGGAGYIGSHVVKQLLEETQYDVVVVDNLSTGHQTTIDKLQTIRPFEFITLDLKVFDDVEKVLKHYEIEAIMHFAASIVVPESVENPLKYYLNNTINTTHLVAKAVKLGVKKFIFSSTAAVYGEPQEVIGGGLDESTTTAPINPYGMSKLMSEQVLQDAGKSYENFNYVIFRYFNVAGADMFYENGALSPRIGQSFPDATHLIKVASEAALGKREKVAIFGDDYDTPDGTGVRDYIHVDDLASAHILALTYLEGNQSDIFNVGYSQGYSVKEVIETVKCVTESDFKVVQERRREGDPGLLIANNTKIKSVMQWKPKYDRLESICESAYMWEKEGLK
jgi:UDP-glucose 4-epimerase